jgi:hypothetical protein
MTTTFIVCRFIILDESRIVYTTNTVVVFVVVVTTKEIGYLLHL